MFTRKKVQYCNFKEINSHLHYCYENKQIEYREKHKGETFGNRAFIVDRLKNFEITYKYGDNPCTYIFDKSTGDTEDHQQITGLEAYRVLSMYTHINKVIDSKEDAPFSAKGLLWKNKKYEGQRVQAICYDMNSAYSYAMIQDMPDTSVPPKAKVIGAGEIGFDVNGNRQTSGYSIYVFRLIESPFKKFVQTYYDKKNKAKTKAERRKAKEYLNFCVGFLQNRDPYTRAQIVGLANDLILSLIDENTLYCNTDSIVCLKEREDLKLGDNIGEWKIEHRGDFAYVGFNYQWNLDKPSIRGKTKSYFDDNWDILKDELPECNNSYYFDRIKGAMLKCEN
jgi:hypothetical protein